MTVIPRSFRLGFARRGTGADPDDAEIEPRLHRDPAGDDARQVPARSGRPDGRVPERIPIAGLDRRSVVLLTACLIVAWLVFVFSRAVADSATATQRVAELRAGNATIEQRLEARQTELAIVQSPAFVALQARAYGLGSPKEQVFSLNPGAPPPPSITPLGEEARSARGPSPLDAWLDLLFGG